MSVALAPPTPESCGDEAFARLRGPRGAVEVDDGPALADGVHVGRGRTPDGVQRLGRRRGAVNVQAPAIVEEDRALVADNEDVRGVGAPDRVQIAVEAERESDLGPRGSRCRSRPCRRSRRRSTPWSRSPRCRRNSAVTPVVATTTPCRCSEPRRRNCRPPTRRSTTCPTHCSDSSMAARSIGRHHVVPL